MNVNEEAKETIKKIRKKNERKRKRTKGKKQIDEQTFFSSQAFSFSFLSSVLTKSSQREARKWRPTERESSTWFEYARAEKCDGWFEIFYSILASLLLFRLNPPAPPCLFFSFFTFLFQYKE